MTKETAEIEIGPGATISGKVVTADVDAAKQASVGEANTQTNVEAAPNSTVVGQDLLQQRYEQRTELRDLDQSRAQRNFDQSSDQRRYDQRYDSPSGSQQVTFQNPDSARIWEALERVGNRVNNVDVKLDDLPNRVFKLEAIVTPLPVPVVPSVFNPPIWMIVLLIFLSIIVFSISGIFMGMYLF